MKLSTFETIDEKRNAYKYEQINSFDDAINKIEKMSELKKTRPIYFRGLADGSWKIFSFAQREWITRELDIQYASYFDFISQFLNFTKNKYALYLRSSCKIVTDISAFSSLQHYGAPTPFVDWTSDFNVALYFATQTNALCLGGETSSFVSVYWLEVGNGASTPNNDLYSLSKLIENYNQSLNNAVQSVGRSPLRPEIFYKNATQFDVWKKFPILWISESEKDYLKISNPRRDLQGGAFVYSSDPNKSLDEIFNGKSMNNVHVQYNGLLLPKIHCIDIHKSLIPKLKKYISEIHYDAANLGLNDQNWGETSFQEFLEV